MSFLVNSFVYSAAVSGPAFHALTPDTGNDYIMEGVLVGTGDLTTTHTAVLYALDIGDTSTSPFGGPVYQQFPANAEVWSGGRCVLSGSPQAGSDVSSVHGNESGGAPLAEMPYLQYYPAATNIVHYSNLLTPHGGWWSAPAGITVTEDQVGLTGEPDTATRFVTGTNWTAIVSAGNVSSGAGQAITSKWWVKKDAAGSTITEFYLTLDAGQLNLQFNFQTQAFTVRFNSLSGTYELGDAGDWWVIQLSGVCTGSGSAITSAFYPTYSASAGVVVDVGQSEIHLGKTIAQVRGLGPIFTTTAAVSTDATVYSLDASNHSDTEGGYYSEVLPSVSTTSSPVEFTGDFEIVSLNNAADLLYYDAANFQMESTDGTNTAAVSFTTATDTALQIGLAYGSSNMRINVDGTWGAAATYDGGYPTSSPQAMDVFRSAGYAFGIRELRRYDETYAAAQTTIDGLMP